MGQCGLQKRAGNAFCFRQADQLTERTVNGIATRDPFVNNLIPVSRFDPVSV